MIYGNNNYNKKKSVNLFNKQHISIMIENQMGKQAPDY